MEDQQSLAEYIEEYRAKQRNRPFVLLYVEHLLLLFGLAHPVAALFGKNRCTFDWPAPAGAHPDLITVRYRICEWRRRLYIIRRWFVYR